MSVNEELIYHRIKGLQDEIESIKSEVKGIKGEIVGMANKQVEINQRIVHQEKLLDKVAEAVDEMKIANTNTSLVIGQMQTMIVQMQKDNEHDKQKSLEIKKLLYGFVLSAIATPIVTALLIYTFNR